MFTSIPRLAHRCYHVWTKQTEKVRRNAFGALIKERIEVCERCRVRQTVRDLVCEAPKREEQELAIAQSA